MKKLIKFAILVVVLSVFSFSNNTTITKVREVVKEKGEKLYEKGVSELQKSENETVKKSAELIK